LVIGGADRNMHHFNDLLVGQIVSKDGKPSSIFQTIECKGDVPTPRSGHSTVSYGKFVFLFGGINFLEEEVYNDLYILDTGNFYIK
jgi:hypothetical protein